MFFAATAEEAEAQAKAYLTQGESANRGEDSMDTPAHKGDGYRFVGAPWDGMA